MIAWLVGLTAPVFDLGLKGCLDAAGAPSFETQFSWRDLILIAGGLFLMWKATKEIHHHVDPPLAKEGTNGATVATITISSVLVQIVLLDMVFSVDSILTAVGMTDNLAVMAIAVVTAVAVMLLAAEPLANFIKRNPTVVMLALGFLLMIGAVLIADGFGVHVPKGYILWLSPPWSKCSTCCRDVRRAGRHDRLPLSRIQHRGLFGIVKRLHLICRWAMQAGSLSFRRLRRLRPSSTTLHTIDASLPR